MAEISTIARPYAKAAFSYAQEQGQLAEWSDQLTLLASLSGASKVRELLDNPVITAEQQGTILSDLCGDELGAAVKRFVGMLAENRRLLALNEIHQEFDRQRADLERTVEVSITSAFALSDEQENGLAETLKRKLERNVSVSTEVDQALIGGVVVRAGDLVIDSSMRGKLTKMKEFINS